MGNDNTPPYQDTCQGDSGGPVIFNLASPTNVLSGNNSDDRLAGITSWGQGCGLANLPGGAF
jgi:secreted trypsin-like serine protease